MDGAHLVLYVSRWSSNIQAAGGAGGVVHKAGYGTARHATDTPPSPGAAARTPGGRTPVARAPVAAAPDARVVSGGWQIEGLPDIVRSAGPQAAERTVECVTAQIRNPYTRAAYAAAVTRFFTWCDARGLALATRHDPRYRTVRTNPTAHGA